MEENKVDEGQLIDDNDPENPFAEDFINTAPIAPIVSKPQKEKPETTMDVSELEVLRQKIDKLTKQTEDNKKWGQENRQAFILAKKKLELAKQKLEEKGVLYDESDTAILDDVFNSTFATEAVEEVEVSQEEKTYLDLQKNLESFKIVSDEDEQILNRHFESFFHHINNFVSNKKLSEIKTYLANEEPKKALKYVLGEGKKYYNDIYKKISEKGDGYEVMKDLNNRIQELENNNKKLLEQLDDTEGKVYSKTNSGRTTSANRNKKDDFDPESPFNNNDVNWG